MEEQDWIIHEYGNPSDSCRLLFDARTQSKASENGLPRPVASVIMDVDVKPVWSEVKSAMMAQRANSYPAK